MNSQKYSQFSYLGSIEWQCTVDSLLNTPLASGALIRTLYLLLKTRRQKTSLGYLCRKAKIPSKGYLALVMKGERNLNRKYWDSLAAAFELSSSQVDSLKVKLQRDRAKPALT